MVMMLRSGSIQCPSEVLAHRVEFTPVRRHRIHWVAISESIRSYEKVDLDKNLPIQRHSRRIVRARFPDGIRRYVHRSVVDFDERVVGVLKENI